MTRDALCGVTTEGSVATKLTSGYCPRAGGAGHGQGSRDALRTLCASSSSAQLTGLWEWHRDPFFLSPSPRQSLPGPDLWDTKMPSWEKGCVLRETTLGSAASFQVLRLLMAFSTRERMTYLCAITATSFWSHDRQKLSQTCPRLSLGGGNLFTSRIQIRLWLVRNIKALDGGFFSSLGCKQLLVVPGLISAHTGPA